MLPLWPTSAIQTPTERCGHGTFKAGAEAEPVLECEPEVNEFTMRHCRVLFPAEEKILHQEHL